eukprot:TRINITY_DN9773_c0_g1_i2.p1 TRINITY_DN9773_c0_g1~~TRINITY_DN9773_c0_g1_i2.p1  ORF type:complete len:119 (-),score=4.48 TRINITY_DN9773_c0_g1_i2:405-761(-)
MEICFTLNSKWDTESCHSYAELSLEGNVQSYIAFQRHQIVCLCSLCLKHAFEAAGHMVNSTNEQSRLIFEVCLSIHEHKIFIFFSKLLGSVMLYIELQSSHGMSFSYMQQFGINVCFL